MWTWECFTPHPPIIVPSVGRGREREAQATVDGMKKLRSLAGGNPPEILFLLSPHAPFSGGLTFTLAEKYAGNFSSFGAPSPSCSYGGADRQGTALAKGLASSFPVTARSGKSAVLDHGSLVPLSYLAPWEEEPPRIVLANPIGLTLQQAFDLGQFLAGYEDPSLWGLLASGDLSHRVTPDAPAGYSPLGAPFDEKIASALRENKPSILLSLDEGEIDEAGECGLRSALVFLGLGAGRKTALLSYEAPFGVGYATAFASLNACPDLARNVLETALSAGRRAGEEAALRFPDFPELRRKAACFVTLKKGGDLRGCIGTILPRRETLRDEIAANAMAAALEDPRFPPVTEKELEDLSISVDILSAPENIDSLSSLDPDRYGVIIEKGGRRGVLLPDLEGVDTAEEQISIAAGKAGISSLEGASLSRFTVTRVKEVPLP